MSFSSTIGYSSSGFTKVDIRECSENPYLRPLRVFGQELSPSTMSVHLVMLEHEVREARWRFGEKNMLPVVGGAGYVYRQYVDSSGISESSKTPKEKIPKNIRHQYLRNILRARKKL